jgi:hypothetical protein
MLISIIVTSSLALLPEDLCIKRSKAVVHVIHAIHAMPCGQLIHYL